MSFEDDLSAVEEHVAEARRMVQRQKGLIVRLGAAGASTLDAQRIFGCWNRTFGDWRTIEISSRPILVARLMTSGRPLAEELREVYPDTVNKVVDLFVRITADEKALSALHQARPPGVMEHLLSAELHARDSIASLATRRRF